MKYILPVRILHKVLAFLIIAQLLLGFGYAKGFLNFSWVITLHKSFGLSTFFIIILMIIVRTFSIKPKYNPPLPIFQLIVAKLVHLGMYLSALGMVLSGLLGSMFMNYSWKIFFIITFPEVFEKNIPLGAQIFSYHYIFASILLILVIMHITAALFHKFVLKDDIMARIK